MNSFETSTQPQSSQPPATLFNEVSDFVRQLPAWLFALISLFGIFVLYQFVGGLLTLFLFGRNLEGDSVTAFRIATMVGQIVFILVPTVLLAKLRFVHLWSSLRVGRFRVSHILLTIVAVLALQQLLQAYMLLQEAIPIDVPPFIRDVINQVKEMMEQMYRILTTADSFAEFLFVVVVIAVTPAVCEELLFRGLIQRTLEEPTSLPIVSAEERKRRGFAAAVIVGVIFGLYHLNPFTLIPLAALGVYFGFVVYRTRNIVPAITAHFFNNFLACLAIYLKLDENFIALSPTERPSASMLALNVGWSAVVFVAATYSLVRSTRGLNETQLHTDVQPSNPASV